MSVCYAIGRNAWPGTRPRTRSETGPSTPSCHRTLGHRARASRDKDARRLRACRDPRRAQVRQVSRSGVSSAGQAGTGALTAHSLRTALGPELESKAKAAEGGQGRPGVQGRVAEVQAQVLGVQVRGVVVQAPAAVVQAPAAVDQGRQTLAAKVRSATTAASPGTRRQSAGQRAGKLVAKEQAAVERHAVAEAEVEVAAEKEAGRAKGPGEGAGGR